MSLRVHLVACLLVTNGVCIAPLQAGPMTAKSFGCVGVVNGKGNLQGVITDGDLRRHMSPELVGRKAGEVMTKGAKTIGPNMLASEAVGFMNANFITNVFVVEGKKVVGILHIHDCLRAGVA